MCTETQTSIEAAKRPVEESVPFELTMSRLTFACSARMHVHIVDGSGCTIEKYTYTENLCLWFCKLYSAPPHYQLTALRDCFPLCGNSIIIRESHTNAS